MYSVRVCILLFSVLDLDYDSKMISKGQLIVVVENKYDLGQELKRLQSGPWCRYIQHNPESARHRYSPGSRRRAVEDHTTRK